MVRVTLVIGAERGRMIVGSTSALLVGTPRGDRLLRIAPGLAFKGTIAPQGPIGSGKRSADTSMYIARTAPEPQFPLIAAISRLVDILPLDSRRSDAIRPI